MAAFLTAHEPHELLVTDDPFGCARGIMWDLEVQPRANEPLHSVVIWSVSVKGNLGQVEIHSTPNSFDGPGKGRPRWWTKHYEGSHSPSPDVLQEFQLNPPLVLKPGTQIGLYVHASEQKGVAFGGFNWPVLSPPVTKQDHFLKFKPARIHGCWSVFTRRRTRRAYGQPWQPRAFVGKVSYNVRHYLWTPHVHHHFPSKFQTVACFMLWAREQPGSLHDLPRDLVKYILSMCPWQ